MKPMQTAVFDMPEFDPDRVGSYRPRISPEQLRYLWVLKQRTRKPITALVAEALEGYLAIVKGGETAYELGKTDTQTAGRVA